MDNEYVEIRKQKLQNLINSGVNPYPDRFDRTHNLGEAEKLKVGLKKVRLAGRLVLIRDMGRLCFSHIQDQFGKFQIAFNEKDIGKDKYKFFIKNFDLGDFIGVEGEIFKTHKGEKTLLVKKFEMLGKALRPLPDKWHGIVDVETKYRQRYLDLLMEKETRDTFVFRSEFIRALREFYWENDFMEVETSTFLHSATGATATPYKTHNNALDIDVYLRISHELPLKELIIGGLDKVFELGKAYRNEGFDPSHLPEHTHLEHYCAYWDFEDNIKFTEKMFTYLFKKLKLEKKTQIENRDGKKELVDWTTPWKRINFIELIRKDTGLDVMKYSSADELRKDIKKKGIVVEGMSTMSLSGLVDNLYKKVSRPKIVNPTILYGYPKYLQPLARVNNKDKDIVDQFQLVVNGWEIVKAYSELVDPIDQKERFDDQKKSKKKGENEVMEGDDEFVLALEYGAPPISGWGMGVDRVIALLTGHTNLRDVVLFPLVKPRD